MIKYTPKPKLCPCGIKFTPRGIQKYHSPQCELKFKTGNVNPEDLMSLDKIVLYHMARGKFQVAVKKRDAGKSCISCGKQFGKSEMIHAGHLFPANQFPGMVFVEQACNSQCDYCNVGLDGNYENYEKGLIIRLGMVNVEDLKLQATFARYTTYSKPELIEIIEKYK